jgi:hypothetical protein
VVEYANAPECDHDATARGLAVRFVSKIVSKKRLDSRGVQSTPEDWSLGGKP